MTRERRARVTAVHRERGDVIDRTVPVSRLEDVRDELDVMGYDIEGTWDEVLDRPPEQEVVRVRATVVMREQKAPPPHVPLSKGIAWAGLGLTLWIVLLGALFIGIAGLVS